MAQSLMYQGLQRSKWGCVEDITGFKWGCVEDIVGVR